ncbi:MAG: amidohydrolase family protein [Tissierellia bacterium]|nr:amidohydrolase family protein [Tissierellia bacterium]
MDLVIRNACLRGKDGLWDIAVENKKFAAILPKILGNGKKEIDAQGNLMLPPFGDPHLHLDAVLCSGEPRYNMSGGLLEGIQIWGERKKYHNKEMIRHNALEVIKWEVAHGVLHIRGHLDATDPHLLGLETLLEIKDQVKDIVNLQLSAFPQDGIFTNPNGAAQLEKCLKMGADCVGGAPHLEMTYLDGVRDIQFVFDLAEKYDRIVDIHVDETADGNSRFIEYMCKEAVSRGMEGLVSASHITAMDQYNNDYAFKIIGNLKRADINVITNPTSNSACENRLEGYPKHRALARVNDLLERGVNVTIANDSVMNPWHILGQSNLLHTANLLAHYGHMNGFTQIKKMIDMITYNSAKTFLIQDDYGIDVGKNADFIVLDAKNEIDAVRLCSECLYVVKEGKIIVETIPAKRSLHFREDVELVDMKIKPYPSKVKF